MTMHYTYLHRRNDSGAVFYIGKGSASRAHSSRGRSEYWSRIVKKAGRTVEILAPWRTEREAFDHEVFLISCFRSMGAPIVNMTDGGDGMSGHRHTEETKERMRLAAIGKKRSAATRERMRQLSMGRSVTEGARAKIGEFHSRRARPKSEYDNQRATNAKPETKDRRSKAMKAMLANPVVKAKMLLSRRSSPDWARSVEGHRKPVVCIETGERYESATFAASALGLAKTNISAVCNGKRKTTGGLSFSWATEREVNA